MSSHHLAMKQFEAEERTAIKLGKRKADQQKKESEKEAQELEDTTLALQLIEKQAMWTVVQVKKAVNTHNTRKKADNVGASVEGVLEGLDDSVEKAEVTAAKFIMRVIDKVFDGGEPISGILFNNAVNIREQIKLNDASLEEVWETLKSMNSEKNINVFSILKTFKRFKESLNWQDETV